MAAVLAIAGILATILPGYQVRTFDAAASDFKTVYASAWCFARGINGYSFSGIQSVFARFGVVSPPSWYGHAPVYPPFTLAVIAPLTLIPMVPAIYLWTLACAGFWVGAMIALARAGEEQFGLGRGWRLLLIALAAASPLVSFGLQMGNVSVMVSALCILAVVPAEDTHGWFRAAGLAVALALKPHLAFWVLPALLLLPGRRGKVLALRTCAAGAALAAAILLWMAAHHQVLAQTHDFGAMLHGELTGGSMDPDKREIVAVPAQITSLRLLLGYLLPARWVQAVTAVALGSLGLLLGWISTRISARRRDLRLLCLAAWCAFGMLASYHRAHDGTLLLLLLPVLVARLRRCWRDGLAWWAMLLYAGVSLGPEAESFRWFSNWSGWHILTDFTLYRQVAFLSLLIFLTLLVALATLGSARPANASSGA